jgi:hypothetical protein
MASCVPPLWKLIFGSFVLSHVATSSHSSTIIDIAKVTPLGNNWSHPSKRSLRRKNFMKLTRPLGHLIWVYEVPLG